MKELRLLVSDIDGTLVRDDKSLGEPVIAAVGRLQAAGVPVSIISARPPSGMLWIAEKLGLTAPIGAFNGGTILKPDGAVLAAHRLSPQVARTAFDLIDRPAVTRWVFSAGRWHAERPDDHDERERKASGQEPAYGGDFAPLLATVDKMVAVSDDPALLAELEEAVTKAVGSEATVGRSQTYYLDITAMAANKGDGVAALAKTAGVMLDQVAVIGDQFNDVPMFRRAGLSIAMGQGPAEVRAAAMHVTGTNDADGVARAIDGVLLPLLHTP